jgi:thiamine biosynthesis lipoprotein
MGVDLGGIAKGLALDRAGVVLRATGVPRALLNLGGEILALGRDWDVSLAHPAARLEPAVRIKVSDSAVSTSGQSEHGFVVAGKRYGHILDPRTGEPVASNASVTVVAASATRADAISTALFVMGRERAAEFAAAHTEIGVVWLEPAGQGVRVWKWNLESVAAARGAHLEGMN